jgi:hypothetical protein
VGYRRLDPRSEAGIPKAEIEMAELTHLDEKLAEVLGLAPAAQVATKGVATRAGWHVGGIRDHSSRLAGDEDPSESA